MSVFNKAEGTALPSLLGHALIWTQAQPSQPPAGESWITLIIMLALMMVFFYFFLVRPQRKRQQEHQALLESLRRGDEVITIGESMARSSRSKKIISRCKSTRRVPRCAY
jgi:preprotein translocase YajC subunit